MSAGIQLSLQVTRGQLNNQHLSEAPPPHPAQKRAISFGHRTKGSDRGYLQKTFVHFMT